jgi:hypothetical protein
MFAHRQSDPFILTSVCPSSCALVAFALRLGGTIDPEFLLQCQILDPKFQKAVDSLKAVPLTFEPLSTNYGYQEDIFLDMDASNSAQFYDPWEFKQHNTWIGSHNQWDSTYAVNDDIVIDFI